MNDWREHQQDHIRISVSGGAAAGKDLVAGCDFRCSVCGGLFHNTALLFTQAAQAGDFATVATQSRRLEPLWALFRQHGGSIRVMSAAAAILGLVDENNLPRPLRALSSEEQRGVRQVIETLELS